MLADVVVHTADAALYEAPEAFDGVGVRIANDVDLFAVLDAPMGVFVPMVSKIVIDRVIVGEHHRLRQDVLFDDAEDRVLLNVLRGVGANAAPALNDAHNRSLVSVLRPRTPALPRVFPPTYISSISTGFPLPPLRRLPPSGSCRRPAWCESA